MCAPRWLLQALSETLAALELFAKLTLTSVGPDYQTQPESWGIEEFWGTPSKSWYYWWLGPSHTGELHCDSSIVQNFSSSEVHSLRKPGIDGRFGRCRSQISSVPRWGALWMPCMSSSRQSSDSPLLNSIPSSVAPRFSKQLSAWRWAKHSSMLLCINLCLIRICIRQSLSQDCLRCSCLSLKPSSESCC